MSDQVRQGYIRLQRMMMNYCLTLLTINRIQIVKLIITALYYIKVSSWLFHTVVIYCIDGFNKKKRNTFFVEHFVLFNKNVFMYVQCSMLNIGSDSIVMMLILKDISE